MQNNALSQIHAILSLMFYILLANCCNLMKCKRPPIQSFWISSQCGAVIVASCVSIRNDICSWKMKSCLFSLRTLGKFMKFKKKIPSPTPSSHLYQEILGLESPLLSDLTCLCSFSYLSRSANKPTRRRVPACVP